VLRQVPKAQTSLHCVFSAKRKVENNYAKHLQTMFITVSQNVQNYLMTQWFCLNWLPVKCLHGNINTTRHVYSHFTEKLIVSMHQFPLMIMIIVRCQLTQTHLRLLKLCLYGRGEECKRW